MAPSNISQEVVFETASSLLQVDVVGGEESELALALAEPPTLVHLKVWTDGAQILQKRGCGTGNYGSYGTVGNWQSMWIHINRKALYL